MKDILLLTTGINTPTLNRYKEEMDMKRVSYDLLLLRDIFLQIENGKSTVKNIQNLLLHDYAYIIPYSPKDLFPYLYMVANSLTSNQFMLNQEHILENKKAYDKQTQYLQLANKGVPLINTIMPSFEIMTSENINQMNIKFPLIVKGIRGAGGTKEGKFVFSQGIAVHLITTLDELNACVIQYGRGNIVIQEYFPASFDLRILMLGGKILGVMKREGQNDFRNNYSLGGKVSEFELSQEVREICEKATEILHFDYCGVDLIPTKEGFKILEVNNFPHFSGFELALKKNIAKEIIDFGFSQQRINNIK